jgi:hypothetical protein
MISCTAAVPLSAAPCERDVMIYGATAGGAIAAIAASQEGMSVVLVEPGRHVGGMISGGLGRTDHGRKAVVGGLSREFFRRVGAHYGEPITWYFEPHVAESVLRDWLKSAGVEVHFGRRIESVETADRRITSVRMTDGSTYLARVFVDAGYEGDLMARAGVSYTWGREGQDQYGESLAGVREKTPKHQFDVPISPYDENGDLLPGVYGGDPGRPGEADRKVQAYNFRLCISRRQDNQVPFPRPPEYDPKRYELLKRYLAKKGKELQLGDILSILPLPNDKADVNNNGPVSTDHIGGNWDYPEGSYDRRREIWEDHVHYQQGLFYFIANDPSVPHHIQDELHEWGLAKDEFVDNDHWPHQLYVREARRMVGAFVMTQRDLQTERTKRDSIGMGSYNSDSHNVQRIPTPDGYVMNEGDMQVPVQPYEIAYRALTPRSDECTNLLVVGTLSASHVAYSSIRMEPVYMIVGHAAGIAAADSVKRDVPVQNIDVDRLQDRLRRQAQVLSLDDCEIPHVSSKELPGIVVDNLQAEVRGEWTGSTANGPWIDHGYLHDGNIDKEKKSVRFVANLPKSGEYELRIAYSSGANRATNVRVRFMTADGERTILLNQRTPPETPPFHSLGTYRFSAGPSNWLEVDAAASNGYIVADAVQWRPVIATTDKQ